MRSNSCRPALVSHDPDYFTLRIAVSQRSLPLSSTPSDPHPRDRPPSSWKSKDNSPQNRSEHGSVWTVRSAAFPPTAPAIPLLPTPPTLAAPPWLILQQSVHHPPPDKLSPPSQLQIRSLSPPLLPRFHLPPSLTTSLAEPVPSQRGPRPETPAPRQAGVPPPFS